MSDGLHELRAAPLCEAKALCGCAFVVAQRRAFHAREARWYTATEMVVVPCQERHAELAREVAQEYVGEAACQRTVTMAAAEMVARVGAS